MIFTTSNSLSSPKLPISLHVSHFISPRYDVVIHNKHSHRPQLSELFTHTKNKQSTTNDQDQKLCILGSYHILIHVIYILYCDNIIHMIFIYVHDILYINLSIYIHIASCIYIFSNLLHVIYILSICM